MQSLSCEVESDLAGDEARLCHRFWIPAVKPPEHPLWGELVRLSLHHPPLSNQSCLDLGCVTSGPPSLGGACWVVPPA